MYVNTSKLISDHLLLSCIITYAQLTAEERTRKLKFRLECCQIETPL